MIKLEKLHIRNYALVTDTEIDFDSGLSIITGETGSGKSLLVGAISMLLGERGRSDIVRRGEKLAVIEGCFRGDFSKLEGIFIAEEIGLDSDKLILTRELYNDGRSRCLVNDQRVAVGVLKKIGERICDLHGQHQHQWLLDPSKHLWFLDNYTSGNNLSDSYKQQLKEYKALNNKIIELTSRIKSQKEREELYSFQLQEIDTAGITNNEEEILEIDRKKLENIERIRKHFTNAKGNLDNDNGSIGSVTAILSEIKAVINDFSDAESLTKELESVRITLQETSRTLEEYLSELSEDPQRLEEIGERLSEIYQLKRKYGGNVKTVLEYRDQIAGSLDTSALEIEELTSLQNQLSSLEKIIIERALQLQKQREKAAKKLSVKMKDELKQLGITEPEFSVQFEKNSDGETLEIENQQFVLNEFGICSGQFFFSANIGEVAKPLAKIASGGEISRVMLALKSLLSGADQVDLLLFDEIDAGIGGETAMLVGKKLKKLANNQQVIAITHLQQIASFSDNHYKAMKESSNKRTESYLLKLDKKERLEELGRMISGVEFGKIEKAQVEKLLKEAKN